MNKVIINLDLLEKTDQRFELEHKLELLSYEMANATIKGELVKGVLKIESNENSLGEK